MGEPEAKSSIGRRAEIAERYRRDLDRLWRRALDPRFGAAEPPLIEPAAGDRRFAAPAWTEQPYFDLLKQSYLLWSRCLLQLVDTSDLAPRAADKLRICVRHYVDALAPTNFAATNPEAIALACESGGASLARGFANFTRDAQLGRVTMTDESAFEVGGNLALTSGAVIFENPLCQLIQYAPLNTEVNAWPLLIVPPCISKYYILDLQPESSFVRYCVERGHTVFLISWRNVTSEQGRVEWDDYLSQGVLPSLAIAREVTGSDAVNTLGFCVGGVLLACALAVLRARKQCPAASMTLLATMLDYELSGDLGALIDDAYVASREAALQAGTIVGASEIAMSFAGLRANEFVWNYAIQGYLMGRTPPPSDLMYWTSDQANLPGAMFAYYLRNLYLENNLARPGRLTMCGMPVDLATIDVPAYVFAARDDHISPWRCVYASARLLGSELQFVLGASGHVAGVVNPPSRNRRNFWIAGESGSDPERWLARAKSHSGSWWTHWNAWVQQHGGGKVRASTTLGDAEHRPIEPAPGRYVKTRV